MFRAMVLTGCLSVYNKQASLSVDKHKLWSQFQPVSALCLTLTISIMLLLLYYD